MNSANDINSNDALTNETFVDISFVSSNSESLIITPVLPILRNIGKDVMLSHVALTMNVS